jgi:hypothetical protein
MDTSTDAAKIGGFLAAIGAMQAWQVEDVLLVQRAGDTRLFGEIAIGLGSIDDAALQLYVESRFVESVRAATPAPSGTRPAAR